MCGEITYVLCSAYHGHLTLLKQISSHKLAARGDGSQSAAHHVSIVSQQEEERVKPCIPKI